MPKNNRSNSGKSSKSDPKGKKTSVRSKGKGHGPDKKEGAESSPGEEGSINNFESLEAENEAVDGWDETCDQDDQAALESFGEGGIGEGPSDAGELEYLLEEGFESLAEAPADSGSLEKLIGADDRRPVADSASYPFHSICYLLIRTKQGRLLAGTGWLVAPKLVVTAGHCIFRRDERDYVRSIRIYRGGSTDPKFSRTSSKFYLCQSYPHCSPSEKTAYDYGAIVLDKGFPNTGTLGVGVYADQSLHNETLNLVGYPTDKRAGTLWHHARPVRVSGERVLEYQIDTYPGMSGAPVIDVVRGEGDPKYIVVGIHSGSIRNRPLNHACRIVDKVWENIGNWRDQSGS